MVAGLALGGGVFALLRHRRHCASRLPPPQQEPTDNSSITAAQTSAPVLGASAIDEALTTTAASTSCPSAAADAARQPCGDRLLELRARAATCLTAEAATAADDCGTGSSSDNDHTLPREQAKQAPVAPVPPRTDGRSLNTNAAAAAEASAAADVLAAADAAVTEAAAALDDCCAESRSESDSDSASDGEAASPSGRQSLAAYLSRHGLERCVFVKVLGQGGCGRADLVTIPLPGGGAMEAVRKVILRRADGGPRTEALRQEVAGMRAAQGCDCAVQLLGWSDPQTADDPHALLIDYVPGVSLADHLDLLHYTNTIKCGEARKKGKKGRKPPPPRTLLSIPLLKHLAKSVLTAVDVMHSNNMCHGDIKSENVFVDESAADCTVRFVLGDMGTAEATDSAGKVLRGRIGGTYGTAAPEQQVSLVGGSPACGLTRMIDLAAVGLLLAEAAEFRVEQSRLIAYARFEDDLDEWVPEGCRDLCEKLLAPSPSDRPSAKQALAHWWLNE